MTLQEMPILTEEPVRYVAATHKDAFFLHYNGSFAQGQAADVVVVNPFYQRLTLLNVYYVGFWLIGVVLLLVTLGVAYYQYMGLLIILILNLGFRMPTFLLEQYGSYRDWQLSNRFLYEGQIVEGEVLECTTAVANLHPFNSAFILKIRYRFVTPDDEVLTGYVQEPREEFRGRPLPAPGTPVYVLYFDNQEHYLL